MDHLQNAARGTWSFSHNCSAKECEVYVSEEKIYGLKLIILKDKVLYTCFYIFIWGGGETVMLVTFDLEGEGDSLPQLDLAGRLLSLAFWEEGWPITHRISA